MGIALYVRGGRLSVYWCAYLFYRKKKYGTLDLVIDECNTIPFFARFYAREPGVLFVHQLAREIWFYEMPFPISWVGYAFEPLYMRLLSKSDVITISRSTKADMVAHGFDQNKIHIISEGITIRGIDTLSEARKSNKPMVLSIGSLRPMKRVDHVVRAFEIAKETIPDLELIIAGDASGPSGIALCAQITKSNFKNSIQVLGRVDERQKAALLRASHILAVTSVREGWGLVVTEANSQGTPAAVYNVPGLRDSVRHNETGWICAENTPKSLAATIVAALQDAKAYRRCQAAAWDWSKEITFDRSYSDFRKAVSALVAQ